MTDLQKYIESLSKEEQIQFKDLINECIKRENNITNNSKTTKENLNKWIKLMNQNNEKLLEMNEAINELKSEIAKLYLRELSSKNQNQIN